MYLQVPSPIDQRFPWGIRGGRFPETNQRHAMALDSLVNSTAETECCPFMPVEMLSGHSNSWQMRSGYRGCEVSQYTFEKSGDCFTKP